MRHPSRLTFGAVLLGALALASCSSDSLSRKEKDAMFQTHRDFAFAYWAMGPEAYDRCQSQIYKALEYDADDVELRVLLGQVLLRKGGLYAHLYAQQFAEQEREARTAALRRQA